MPIEPVKPWTASWCWPSKHLLQPWNTYVYFRRTVELATKPRRAIVRVSADARYTLFVNGQPVTEFSTRGFHPTGDLGLYVESLDDAKPHVHFDELKVTPI